MSVERSLEAWEEVQRHGQDLADRLSQGFSGLIQSHMAPASFPWPNSPNSKLFDLEFSGQSFGKTDFGLVVDNTTINAILDIGDRIGQVGTDFGACLNGMALQFFRKLPIPLWAEENEITSVRLDADKSRLRADIGMPFREDLGTLSERFRDVGFAENDTNSNALVDGDKTGFDFRSIAHLGKSQGLINVSSTYDSRSHDIESSLVARGDLWRVEASHGNSMPGNENSSLFLVQLGPLLFVRDSTLLWPIHLSKQHLLWYGYDRKNGMHSLCPAVWSKHRRWLLMSMLCLNPLACFPNGQFTYVVGEGLTTRAFVPLRGGLLQAQGRYPGEMRFIFSYKNKWGTLITPMLQWPDKSFSFDVAQPLAWQRSGLMVRPTIQFSVCPTLGGSSPGLQTELIHSVKEQLNLIYGCAFTHVLLCLHQYPLAGRSGMEMSEMRERF